MEIVQKVHNSLYDFRYGLGNNDVKGFK